MKHNLKKTKIIIISGNVGKVKIKGKFPCALCRKNVGSKTTYSSFAGVGFIRDVVVLEVNWKRIANLNVRYVQISKQK